jgi:hypothetical protein
MLACISYFAKRQVTSIRDNESMPLRFKTMRQFKENMKQVRVDKKFESYLLSNGIHIEMAARVFRRFGNTTCLLEAYAFCDTEGTAELLLSDIPTSARAERATVSSMHACTGYLAIIVNC